MKERRQFERFSLTILARAETTISGRKQVFELETRDISASGAFIYNKESFPEGTQFKLNLTVPSERIKELTGAKSLIECEGNVVRSAPAVIAVHFDRDCRILSLRGLQRIDIKSACFLNEDRKGFVFVQALNKFLKRSTLSIMFLKLKVKFFTPE